MAPIQLLTGTHKSFRIGQSSVWNASFMADQNSEHVQHSDLTEDLALRL